MTTLKLTLDLQLLQDFRGKDRYTEDQIDDLLSKGKLDILKEGYKLFLVDKTSSDRVIAEVKTSVFHELKKQ